MSGRSTVLRFFGIFSGAAFLLFWFYDLLVYSALLGDRIAQIAGYASDLLQTAFGVLMPTVGAAILFALSRRIRLRKLWLPALLLSAGRLFFSLPYYYLYYFGLGYDTPDSLLLSALGSLLAIALGFAETMALFFLAKAVLKLRAKSFAVQSTPDLRPFDLSAPEALALLCASLPLCLYTLIGEIVRAVGYLSDYAGGYRVGEILYMTFCFLFDVGLFLLAPVCAAAVKRGIDRKENGKDGLQNGNTSDS